MPEVTFRSIEDLQAAIARLTGPEITKVAERAGRKIGEELRTKLETEPQGPRYPLKWASEDQRRWYFAMRRAKNLPIKYARGNDPMSQDLTQSWVVSQIAGGAVLGNPADYAAYVQSSQYQTEMHKDTGWITDEQAVQEAERERVIERVVLAEIHSMVRGVLG